MIELTEELRRAVQASGEPPELHDPATDAIYVLLRREVYHRLQELYDDSPWTSEERHALAWEAGKHAGWQDMDEYDDYPEAT